MDAVCIATCDHWHGLATVWACQAGKDVYVEKPTSHNIWEGRVMVEAARKYDRIVQVGTQNRTAPYVQAARDYIASGKLGDIPLIIDCIRSRNKPNADIEFGHKSAILIHLANIATALGGRRLVFDPNTEQITNDEEANNHILRKREYREGYSLEGGGVRGT